ncbi:unnamed protein product [Larinioides sclopetarius]|uniref:ABC transporter domain-containing protein n=1 Tax=Larinioides sclopetarius TaxID=280406 RepID=A0AAV1ZQ44_9ARAC
MELSTYIPQWKALMRRDLLLKSRNFYQLITALLLPVTASLYILYQSNQPHVTSSAKIGVEYDLPLIYLDQDLIGIPKDFHLCVAPRDIEENFLNSIQESLSLYGQKRFVQISKFENETELNDRLSKKYEVNGTDCDAGVIIVGNISTSGSYIVRVPDDGCSPVLAQYCSYGMLSNIQQAVDNAYLQEWTGNSNFKLPSSKVRGFIDVHAAGRSLMNRIIKLILVIAFFPLVTIIAENALHEKRMRIKESMLLMGMKPFSFWLAWLVCEVLLIIFITLPVTIALFVANVAPVISILLHFLLLFFLGCTLVVFTMTITRFFSTPMVVNTIVIFLLLSAVASDFSSPNATYEDIKLTECFAMLLSPVAYEKGFNKIMREYDFGEGSTCVLIIFTDFFMYSVFDFILEYLFPYGVSVPWGKLKPGGKKKKKPKKRADVHENEAFIGPMPYSNTMDPYIKLERIKKTYFSCFHPGTTVLDGVTLSILKGEVTCLLGPNGAGKSTLMKVISRVLAPDEGKIITKASVNLGICPQENILHDDMNTGEHLKFFGGLKGIPDTELDSAVTTLLENFDLLSKKNARSKVLSGGQKRKLCVAIAMIGDPEVLLLDEPSSGMSPHARRQMWNLLQEYTKSGCAVLFTTHYLDEAELLSDRIALLNYGKLKYYGTSMDMKKQLGGGYNVRITLQSEPSLYCKSELVSLISDLPSKPKVTLTSDNEIVVKLHSFHAAHCIEFFNKIEEQYKDIGPDSFTISVSSLEEIFSLLAEENSEQNLDASQDEDEVPEFTYATSTWTSISELARARCHLLLRSYYTLFPIILAVMLLSWNRALAPTREITDISTELFKNDIIEIINKSGKPVTEFEKSLYKLNIKADLVKAAVGFEERKFIKAQFRNYEIFNEVLDVNWNWTVSLSSSYALSAVQNLMSNILWKAWYDDLGREIKISVEPITLNKDNLSFFQTEAFVTLLHISTCLIFASLAFGLEIVKEREKKVLWLISTTKNNALPYWISTFIAHFAILSLTFYVVQNMLLIYGVYVFQKFSLWIAFYLSLPGCLLFVYLIGHCFKSYRSADIGMTFSVVIVTISLFIVFLIGVLTHIPYIYVLNILALLLIPIYAPYGLVILLCEDDKGESVTYDSQWTLVCGLVIPVSCFLYALIIIYLGKRKIFKRREKIQVMNEGAWNDEHNPKSTVVLKSVRKAYRSMLCPCKRKETVAIKDLSLSFLEGEIFALMGSNGAGKSTLMKLLSLNVELTSGEIFIRDKYMESITYCAEENTVWSNLTVEEHLRLFAALNGVPTKHAVEVAKGIMKDLDMESHAKKRAKHLSGGYKRKLSIALSLLGNSNLVLLDEPTTGMDPVSKQYLWKKLHQEFPETSDRTLILTTHSSNEAEVNCSRIGLFMDGNLRCEGSSQALKKEFTKGFELTVKLKNEDTEKFISFLMSEIPDSFEKFHRGITLHYYIPTHAFTSMSELFTAVEKIQKFESVEDCFICECSLDQVAFLTLGTIFFIVNQSNKPYIKPSKSVFKGDFPLKGILKDFDLCVAPKDIKEHFLNSIQESLSSYGRKKSVKIWKFEDERHLNERILKTPQFNTTDCDAVINIIGNISTEGTYIVQVKEDRCLADSNQECVSGILSNIQQAVDNAFLQEWTGNSSFKLPAAKIHGIADIHKGGRTMMYLFFEFMLMLFYFPIMTMITENSMHEKTMKIKESMILMGMKPLSYWLAWLICEIMVIVAVILPISIALFFASMSPIEAIFLHFLLWFGFGCTVVIFTMTITRFCSQMEAANLVAVFILIDIIADLLEGTEYIGNNALIDCLLMLESPYAYRKGFNKIMREGNLAGASTAILMTFVDVLLYSALDLILDYFVPDGITFHCRKLKCSRKNSEARKSEDIHEKEALIGSWTSSTDLDPLIRLENIKKAYCCSSTPDVAVLDGVTFSIFKGEVTCLMGPNGVGKTTLMKVISGVLAPDEGKVTTTASLKLGVCPQQNILHDNLTTYEHLQFFGSFKGIPEMKLDSTVTTLLETFDLVNERNTRAKELSSGQKRKLCVALAMIGDPEVLLLDEPSKLMNLQSRRKLWNLLQDYTKSGHTVLFTTHDMDEAELFSDRIALLIFGKLEYYGTTMDLKKQYGGGYNVRINLQSIPSLRCNSELVDLISGLPSKPEVILASDSEIRVKLNSFYAAHCIEFFNKIEEHYKDIPSDCFTISVSALEEIFHLLTEKNSKKISEEKEIEPHNEVTIPKFTYNSSIWTSIYELFRARYHLLFRTFSAFSAITFPVIIVFWRTILFHLCEKVTCISPNLYKNGIIQVMNTSRMPLTDFEYSLTELDMKFELFNSTCENEETSFIKTEIMTYNFCDEKLDVNWNWTVSLINPYALPVLQNMMSNILWKNWHDQLGRELKVLVEPITIFEKDFSSILSEKSLTLLHISSCFIYVSLIMGLEVLREREKNVIWLISTTRYNALPYWISTFVVHFGLLSLAFIEIQYMLWIFGDGTLQEFSIWIPFYISMPGCLLHVYFMGQLFQFYKFSETKMTIWVVVATVGVYIWLQLGVALNIPYIPYIMNIISIFFIPIYTPLGLIVLLYQAETADPVIYELQWKIVCYFIMPLSHLLFAFLITYPGIWQTFKRKELMNVMTSEAWNKVHDPKEIANFKSAKKIYEPKLIGRKKQTLVIKDLNMSFLEGQIYALMCSDGIVKSTIMNILSLNDILSSGEVSMRDKYLEPVSYCPTESTVWPNLTVEENLRVFAVLKGVPPKYADKVTESVLMDLRMKHYAKIKAGYLTRGIQKKISVAFSLLGNSKLVLLDEPTTGMDPTSKKDLWKKLHKEFPGTSNRTLIFSTRSSTEADVESSRIGLFTEGHLRYLGTSKELKKEVNKGFELIVKLKNGYNGKFNHYLVSEIPLVLEKCHRGKTLRYCVPTHAFKSMSELFKAVEKIQLFEDVEDCLINECTFNQTLLEVLTTENTHIRKKDDYSAVYNI